MFLLVYFTLSVSSSASFLFLKPDPAKKIPPPTLPKPKIKTPPCFDAFNECLKEMKTVSYVERDAAECF